MMAEGTLKTILLARREVCKKNTAEGCGHCVRTCKLYCLREPGMTCRDSVLLHADKAQKILNIEHNS